MLDVEEDEQATVLGCFGREARSACPTDQRDL
jgi:hypothetical protein